MDLMSVPHQTTLWFRNINRQWEISGALWLTKNCHSFWYSVRSFHSYHNFTCRVMFTKSSVTLHVCTGCWLLPKRYMYYHNRIASRM
jgi:hypothetical protein